MRSLFFVTVAGFFAVVFFDPDLAESSLVVIIGLLTAAVVHLVANVMLSRDDRRREFRWRGFLHRWMLRIAPLFPVVALVLVLLLQTNVFNPGQLDQWISLLMLPTLLCPALSFFRLRRLALRLSRRRLAEHITIVAVGALVSLLFAAICVWFLVQDVRHPDARFYIVTVMPVSLIVLFNLWALLLLFVIVPRFFRSARMAQENWRRADAARV